MKALSPLLRDAARLLLALADVQTAVRHLLALKAIDAVPASELHKGK
jgi:hypothetical protein